MPDTETPLPRVRQSGVIPYVVEPGGLKVVLITNSSGGWLVPKGHVEPDLTPAGSAAKEAWEEAGLEGVVTPERLGTFDYVRGSRVKVVDLYGMAVTRVAGVWPEMHRRRRLWVSALRAADMVFHPDLARCIAKLDVHAAAA